MEVKLKFNEIDVKEEKEKTLVKVLMLKGEKGDTVSAEWGTITGDLESQTDLKNALDSKANQSSLDTTNQNVSNLQTSLGTKANQSDLNTTNQNVSDINEKVEKKPYYYDTLSDLKNDLSLKDGDCAITLGYNSINDGEGFTYIITNTSSQVEIQEELQNGLYATLIKNNTINNIKNSIQGNKNFNLKMGMTSFLRGASAESIENQINNVCVNYFSCLKQQVRFTFNTDTMKFDLTEADNMQYQIASINKFIQNGGDFKGLHFYTPGSVLLTLFETYSDSVIMEAYYDAIKEFIDLLPYKNIITRLWILNEAGQNVLSDTYKNSIINCINSLQTDGYEISIPMAYVEQYGEVSTDILNQLDFYSQNLYPTNDVYKEYSTIDDMRERFDIEYRIIETFLNNKELVISEFGCSSSWYSFSNPSQYLESQNGKPISIFIEGFFKSRFVARCSQCYFWYYMDAYRYAPYTLLSIKENSEVRYGG